MKRINIPPMTLLLVWSIFMLIVLIYPKIPSPSSKIIGFDKLAHFLLFLVFAVLFLRVKQKNQKKQDFPLWIVAVTISVFGEIIQIPVPGRDFSLFDILANIAGFTTAIIFYQKERYKTILLFIKKKLLSCKR